MKKKKLAAEAAAGEPSAEPAAAERPAKKQKFGGESLRDKQSMFFAAAIVLGIISIVFVLLAKNGINNGKGYFSVQPFHIKKAISLTFLKSSLCAWTGAVLGFAGVVCGVTRNVLKKQNSLISYLIGLVGLILAVIAILAIRYP